MPPQAQTVDLPKRLPLVITPENRDYTTDKDSKLVNCYMERLADGSYWLYKRMGLAVDSQPPGGAAGQHGARQVDLRQYSLQGRRSSQRHPRHDERSVQVLLLS